MSKTVFRYDERAGSLKSPTRTAQGFLRVDGHAARVGIYKYRRADGSFQYELRPEEEVFHPDSLASYDGAPITIGHPRRADGEPEDVTAENVRKYEVGTVTGNARRDGDRVATTSLIKDAAAIRKVEGGLRELSPGYRIRLDETPGSDRRYATPDNPTGRWDAVQRDIRINHKALVPEARGGSTIRLRMDEAEMMPSMTPRFSVGDLVKATADHMPGMSGMTGTVVEVHMGCPPYYAVKFDDQGKMPGIHKWLNDEEVAPAAEERMDSGGGNPNHDDHGRFASGGGPHHAVHAEAAARAHSDSAKVYANGTTQAHEIAAESHRVAGAHAHRAGDSGKGEMHAALATSHANAASKIAKKSGLASDHENARLAHDSAGEAHNNNSNAAMARGDRKAADQHSGTFGQHVKAKREHFNAVERGGSRRRDAALSAADRHKLSDSDFAVPEDEGMPIHDAGHVRAAMARFNQYHFLDDTQRKAAYRRILKAAKAFDIDASGFAEEHRADSMAVLTTTEAGHQHLIDPHDWHGCERGAGETSYAVSEGADSGHSHPWVKDPVTGVITVGDAEGHGHGILVGEPGLNAAFTTAA